MTTFLQLPLNCIFLIAKKTAQNARFSLQAHLFFFPLPYGSGEKNSCSAL